VSAASRSSSDASDVRLVAEIARRYYLDGASKSELAVAYGFTRARVARIIDSARTDGLVRIVVNTPPEMDARLSEQLRSAFDLEHALVVNAPDVDDVLLRTRLGRTTAEFLSEIVTEGDTLGVALGRTLWATAVQLTRLERCSSVALTGVLSDGDMTQGSLEILHRVAAASGGPSYPIYAPWVVSDAATAQLFRAQPEVARALDHHRDLTLSVVAIGSWEPHGSTLAAAISEPERQALTERGVQAEVAGVLFDVDGDILAAELTDRLIGVTAVRLREVPHVVAVAGGRAKWRAVRAVLKGGFITSLVTDAGTARFLMNDHIS
jgi:DNA-binding transcriptional regulator LsrR (DeoR family)